MVLSGEAENRLMTILLVPLRSPFFACFGHKCNASHSDGAETSTIFTDGDQRSGDLQYMPVAIHPITP